MLTALRNIVILHTLMRNKEETLDCAKYCGHEQDANFLSDGWLQGAVQGGAGMAGAARHACAAGHLFA